MSSESLAERLKTFRLSKKLTQKDIADALAYDVSTYNKIEKGVRSLKVSDLSFLYHMGCSIDWLVVGKETNASNDDVCKGIMDKQATAIDKQASALQNSAEAAKITAVALSDLAQAAKETSKVLSDQMSAVKLLAEKNSYNTQGNGNVVGNNNKITKEKKAL